MKNDSDAFMKFANYYGIFSEPENDQKHKMEMTAPVLLTNQTMSFTLSKNFTLENAPKPTNRKI
jgi:hypothetical protein